jgi:hypothetical protein
MDCNKVCVRKNLSKKGICKKRQMYGWDKYKKDKGKNGIRIKDKCMEGICKKRQMYGWDM